jgi:PIN domain nuclease of toxin-antitoxin system
MTGPVVLDASAVLAYVLGEAGAAEIRVHLPEAALSTVNWAEIAQRHPEQPAVAELRTLLVEVGVTFEPLTVDDAEAAAGMRAATRPRGVSLADRCCLALAARLARPVLSTDRALAGLSVGVDVMLAC